MMSDAGDFKGNRPELGHRLPRQRQLGPPGMARRFGGGEYYDHEADRNEAEMDAAGVPEFEPGPPAKKKPGPAPWEALGISRRTYFRRKKGGGG